MAERGTRRSGARRAAAARQGSGWTPSAEAAEREIRRVRASRYRRHRHRVLMFIVALSLALGYLAFGLCFEMVRVEGAGMSPTLESGSVVLCVRQSLLDKLAGIVPEDARRIGKNDLVLFNYQAEPDGETSKGVRSALLIKRVIGMDGDRIDAGGGEIIVNREQIAGALQSSDLVYPVVVPNGRMFVAGDNRTLSVDSRQRAFGMVTEASVVARPVAVIWPVYALGLVK